MEKPGVSIIIPMYNEARGIGNSLSRLFEFTKGMDCEILLYDDGSTDGTHKAIPATLPENVRLVRSETRVGKGKSLTKAIGLAKADTVVYLDADLSSELESLPKLVEEIEDGAAVATGSRLAPGARAHRTPDRLFLSKVYNWLVRKMLGSEVFDHQCGCKAFDREKILSILPLAEADHWFWDTEILVLAQKKGLKVSEVPIEWREGKHTRVEMLKDIPEMFLGVVELRKRLGEFK